MLPDPIPAPAPRRATRARRVLGLVALVLLAHALLLGLLPVGVGYGWQGRVQPLVQPLVQVRRILLPPPEAVVASPEHPPAVHGPAAAPPLAAAAPVVAPAGLRAASRPPPLPAAAPDATPAAAKPGDEDAADAAAGAAALPVYPTRLPAAALLRYDTRRGALDGSAELAWRPGLQRYALTLTGTALSASPTGWHSEGGFDGAGLAPERFTERRRGRDVQAANFQRAKGRITYSGPAVDYPLPPGAQDRLSWMVQLPAILQADAARAAPGSRISIFVSGARGDGDVWTFSVESVAAIELGSGRVDNAVHLRREPRRPYDTRVDVWLDPARSHLPVRVLLAVPQAGAMTEFVLRDITPL